MPLESKQQQSSWSVDRHPLTEAELRLAKHWLGTVFSVPRLLAKAILPSFFVVAITFSLTMATGSVLFASSANATHLTGFLGTILAVAAGAITVRQVFVREQKDNQCRIVRNEPVQRDIDARAGEAIKVKAETVVEIAPVEDEGKKYIFRLAEDTAVMLRIPVDNPNFLAGNARFPNREFTIIRLPTSKLILKIDCTGEALPATVQLPARVDKYQHRDAEPFKVEWSQLLAANAQV